VGEEPLKCSEFFALENMSLARLTPELLRFFSAVGFVPASMLFRSVGRDPLPEDLLPPRDASSNAVVAVDAADDWVGLVLSPGAGASTAATSSSFPEPNIRFSKPPPPAWEEKLLRLFPARLKVSQWRVVGSADTAESNIWRAGENTGGNRRDLA
jgi:hypothetical protein